jgi:hypothetical protein
MLILSHVNHTFFISVPQIEPPTFRHIHCTLGISFFNLKKKVQFKVQFASNWSLHLCLKWSLQHKFNISQLNNGNMQNLFIRNLYILYIDIVHWKHIWHMNFKKIQNSYDICSFISSYFIHQHIYLCVKHIFNTWYFL